MLKKLKVMGVTCLIATALSCALGFAGINNVNASTNKAMKENKAYYYDLNGDGVKEKISYNKVFKKKNDGRFSSVNLFINGKKVYTKKLADIWAAYTIVDLNKKDKTVELNLQIGSDSYVLDYSSFQRWNGKKIVEIETNKNPTLDYLRGYVMTNVKGNGKFNTIVDTPYDLPIGNYYAVIPLQLKNGKIATKTSVYKLYGESKKYKYKVRKNIVVYKKPSKESKKVLTLKKGQKLTIKKIKMQTSLSNRKKGEYGYKNENGFAFVKIEGGKQGWIYLDQDTPTWGSKRMFKDVPGWA